MSSSRVFFRGGTAAVVGVSLLTAAALIAVAGCGSGSGTLPVAQTRTQSEMVSVGAGRAQAFVTTAGSTPLQVGVHLDASVLPSLPVAAAERPAASRHAGHDHDAAPDGLAQEPPPSEDLSFPIPLPKAAGLPFDHVSVDWNPGGHPPPGVYTVPHFDIHFYMMSMDQRRQIVGPNIALSDKPLPQGAIPAGFLSPPGQGVPMMGAHYLNMASPEFNGGRFTHTFIYGAYDGEVTFFEPMITKAFLETKQSVSEAIPQPTVWQKPGYYPTRYRIQHTPDGGMDILLEGFVYRQ